MAQNLENYLTEINGKYVKLDKNKTKRNSDKLNKVLDQVIAELKKNELFNALHKKSLFYGGSYYDNLKVSAPNEYDIGLLLDLPKLCAPNLRPSKKCGYVNVDISLEQINRQKYLKDFRGLSKLIDAENYLSVSKVNQWFQQRVQIALNSINDDSIKMRTSGPAVTLRVYVVHNEYFDVDLVPFFFFPKTYWPDGYRKHNSNDGFIIVPKLLKDGDSRKWRAAFQRQEKDIIRDVGKIKPAMRLIKVLRDNENFTGLKSYFIKTVFLWELQNGGHDYTTKTLSETYLTFMEKLIEHLKTGRINYFWHEQLNLIEDWSDSMRENVTCRLQNILKKIKQDSKNVWNFYSTADLPPTECNNEEAGAQETATFFNRDVALTAAVIGGIGLLSLAGIEMYRHFNKRQQE